MENEAKENSEKTASEGTTTSGSMQEQLRHVKPSSLKRELMTKTNAPQEKRIRKPGDLFTGRRKSSIARVKLVKGSGKLHINKKEGLEYLTRKSLLASVLHPLVLSGKVSEYDIFATVKGGGVSSQADAIKLGIARSLDNLDPGLHSILKQAGLLTRDSRIVERKKYGLHKARRAPQFSKR